MEGFHQGTAPRLHIPPVTPGRRRRLSTEQKRAILAQGLSEQHTISEVGRRYDIPVTLLFRWKRELAALAEREPNARPMPSGRLAQLETRVAELEEANKVLSERLHQVLREPRP